MESLDINKLLRYNLENDIFKSVKNFNKSYKLAVVDRSIKGRNIRCYFKVVIKVIDDKSLFNEIVNNKYYYIDDILRRLYLFDKGDRN